MKFLSGDIRRNNAQAAVARQAEIPAALDALGLCGAELALAADIYLKVAARIFDERVGTWAGFQLSRVQQQDAVLLRPGPAQGQGRLPGREVPRLPQADGLRVQGLSLGKQPGGLPPAGGLGGKVFLQGEPLRHARRGDFRAHIAVVPGLKAVAGNLVLPLGVAENKAVLGAVLLQPGVGRGVLKVVQHAGAVDVQGQAGLVLRVAGAGGEGVGELAAVLAQIAVVEAFLGGVGAVGRLAAQGDAVLPGGLRHGGEGLCRLRGQGAGAQPGEGDQLGDVVGGQGVVLVHQHLQIGLPGL